MKEPLEISLDGRTLRAKLLSEIDHHTARFIREPIDRAMLLYMPSIVELDFGEVDFMDSSGIGLVLGRASLASEISASVRITGLSGNAMRLFRISGVERVRNISIV